MAVPTYKNTILSAKCLESTLPVSVIVWFTILLVIITDTLTFKLHFNVVGSHGEENVTILLDL